jgi:hypothetical protein
MSHRAQRILNQVVDLLNGQEWSADTVEDISTLLRAWGFTILDLDEVTEADEQAMQRDLQERA